MVLRTSILIDNHIHLGTVRVNHPRITNTNLHIRYVCFIDALSVCAALCYVSCIYLNANIPSLCVKYPPPGSSYPPSDQDRAYYPPPQYPPPGSMAAIHPHAQAPDAYRLPPPPGAYRPDPYGQPPATQVVHYQAAAPRQRTAIACRYCRRRKVCGCRFHAGIDALVWAS